MTVTEIPEFCLCDVCNCFCDFVEIGNPQIAASNLLLQLQEKQMPGKKENTTDIATQKNS